MTAAERIYRVLLRLYPTKHREAYGPAMLQHSRDLNRDARRRGRRHVIALCFRLLKDGLVNALKEHGEEIMSAKALYRPVPWPSVLLAAVPGLLVALSRRHADTFAPLLLILGVGYLLTIALGVPLIWWRRRQFPVWGLMFAGVLTWIITYWVGMGLSQQMGLPNRFGWDLGIVYLNIALAIVFFVVLLRGQRLPGIVWLLFGLIVLINVLGGFIYGSIQIGSGLQIGELWRYLQASLALPAEGFMLVAVGLLAARRHGVLALLFVIGGYGYMFLDSDYLYASGSRDWAGFSLYMVAVSLLYLVVTPIALLRAKTRRGRAMAVFAPALIFLVIRLIAPSLATGQPLSALMLGDVGISLNVLLSLTLAWFLYGHMHDVSGEVEVDDHRPSQATLSNC